MGILLASWLAFASSFPPGASGSGHVAAVGPPQSVVGEYVVSDGFEVTTLSVTAGGRFHAGKQGCIGVEDCNAGIAEVVDGRLVLTPDPLHPRRVGLFLQKLAARLEWALFPEESIRVGHRDPDLRRIGLNLKVFADDLAEGIASFQEANRPEELLPVFWGKDALFLVPPDRGADFCNDVNLGIVRCMAYYGRALEEKPDVEGLPRVPERWKHMLLEAPIRGTIAEVLADGRARVDLGAQSGAWKGMELAAEADGLLSVVVEVDAKSSIIERVHADRKGYKTGEKLSSRSPQQPDDDEK